MEDIEGGGYRPNEEPLKDTFDTVQPVRLNAWDFPRITGESPALNNLFDLMDEIETMDVVTLEKIKELMREFENLIRHLDNDVNHLRDLLDRPSTIHSGYIQSDFVIDMKTAMKESGSALVLMRNILERFVSIIFPSLPDYNRTEIEPLCAGLIRSLNASVKNIEILDSSLKSITRIRQN